MKDLEKKSIECLKNMPIEETTYQVARNVVLDCITNLQEDYEKEHYLVDKLTRQLNDEYKNTEYQCKQKEDYKSRNEKAIEYIKQSIDNPQPFYEYLFGDENGKVENLDKLLNILLGSDKE